MIVIPAPIFIGINSSPALGGVISGAYEHTGPVFPALRGMRRPMRIKGRFAVGGDSMPDLEWQSLKDKFTSSFLVYKKTLTCISLSYTITYHGGYFWQLCWLPMEPR